MFKKILWCTFALLLACIVLFGCASSPATGNAGMTGTGGSPTTSGTTGTGTAAPTRTGTGTAQTPGTESTPRPAEGTGETDDLALTNAIRNKLNDEGITPAMEIQVQVANGEVTLSGKVADQSTADRIVTLVKTVENVKDVDSHLEVSQ